MRQLFLTSAFAAAVVLSHPVEAQAPEWLERLLGAAALPVSANEARREGASDETIREILGAMRRENVPAYEARQILDEERAALREHGPVDNFGAFVQSQLDAGLRGRDLAAAIRAEHAARGIGRGAAGAPPNARRDGREDDRGRERGRPDDRRDSIDRDRDDRGTRPERQNEAERGRSGERGKPEARPGNPPSAEDER